MERKQQVLLTQLAASSLPAHPTQSHPTPHCSFAWPYTGNWELSSCIPIGIYMCWNWLMQGSQVPQQERNIPSADTFSSQSDRHWLKQFKTIECPLGFPFVSRIECPGFCSAPPS
ncbi:hypothetical protein KIL84_021132 [Mauremys mutica]|uniref:Uncharacterized protein n=1 Tax=Mauremys mutica TaxID=74926 RepID=A0A9D4AZP6_9SAUR|nr:hypothetical protein KIL84_021132 [Mauremys mutica]